MRGKGLVYVVLAVLVTAVPAYAGFGMRSGEIGMDLGQTSFDSSVTNESGTDYALRGGYNFSKLLEVEGQYADSSANDVSGDVSLNTYMVNAVFNFHPTQAIVPYCLGGIGQASMKVGTLDDNASAYQLALGSRFMFGGTKRAGLRVELSSLSEKTFNDTQRHSSLNVGFTWRLGS